jgi:hypothetical protein
MADDGEAWISAWEAVKLLKPVMDEYSAQMTICERAHHRLISARAVRLVIEDHNSRPVKISARNDVEVPPEFWWALGGNQSLWQNWSTGDFETYVEERVLYKAYSVKFRRLDIMGTVFAVDTPQRATNVEKSERIFIGHGRSNAWRDLKDFIVERLKLPYDEFNAEPVAGVTNIDRLKKMLDDAAFALLILTAEDEQASGKMQARMNVIHELGLFQGRLGFNKAIILLEDGCEEFSNIHGLGQIRFPAGSISAKFEEVRRVLEREGIIPS